MSIPLTDDQMHALDTHAEHPLRIVDPRTNTQFVLVPLNDYETVREILEDERRRQVVSRIGLRNAGGRTEEEL